MFCLGLQGIEKIFFRVLNSVLEPAIRIGVGSPRLSPVGVVVLETIGRKSGRHYKTPLAAWQVADLLLVSTVRSGSQWIKNLAANPVSEVWLRGRQRPVVAYVIEAGRLAESKTVPPSTLAKLLSAILFRLVIVIRNKTTLQPDCSHSSGFKQPLAEFNYQPVN